GTCVRPRHRSVAAHCGRGVDHDARLRGRRSARERGFRGGCSRPVYDHVEMIQLICLAITLAALTTSAPPPLAQPRPTIQVAIDVQGVGPVASDAAAKLFGDIRTLSRSPLG